MPIVNIMKNKKLNNNNNKKLSKKQFYEKSLKNQVKFNIQSFNKKIIDVDKNKNKAIALFEISEFSFDSDMINSLFFIWYQDNTMPKFPIIETDGTIENNLELLNKYYDEGYRYFLGFSRSTILAGVLPWFLDHPDVIGISLSSGALSLAVPKNVYRLITSLTSFSKSLSIISKNSTNVYYIYDNNELITRDTLKFLENDPAVKDKLKSYPIINESSYNVPDLSNFLAGSTPDDIILLAIYEPDLYSNLYNEGLFFGGNQYTIIGINLDIYNFVEPCASILDKKYFEVNNIFTNTSLFYRENSLYTSFDTLNALKMIEYFIINKNIDNLASYDGTLEFNEFKDLKYSSYLFNQYIKELISFRNYSIIFEDPLLVKFKSFIV